MTKQIIKGLIYSTENKSVLLRPHFSGNFFIVDCTQYKQKKEIKENYSEQLYKQFLKGIYLTYNGKKYYECEYSPYNTDGFKLLSDIGELEFFDDKTEFND